MEQTVATVEENLEIVQDKQEIVELTHDVLDRVGGGIVLILL